MNSHAEMMVAFAPCFEATLLASSVTPESVYDLEAQIDAFALLDPADIETANDILYAPKVTAKRKQQLTFLLEKSKKLLEHYDAEKQAEAVQLLRGFVRFYEFLLHVSCFEDVELHKKYNFITHLLACIDIRHSGAGFDLAGKIRATNFVQRWRSMRSLVWWPGPS